MDTHAEIHDADLIPMLEALTSALDPLTQDHGMAGDASSDQLVGRR